MRYTEETRIRFIGPAELGARFVPLARTILGGVIQRGAVLGKLETSLIRRRFPGGLYIEAGYIGGSPYINIDVTGVNPEEDIPLYIGILVQSFRERLWDGSDDSIGTIPPDDELARNAIITSSGEADGEWGVKGKTYLQDTLAGYPIPGEQRQGVIDYHHESGHKFWCPLMSYQGPYSLTWLYCPESIWWENTKIFDAPVGWSLVGFGINGSSLIVMLVNHDYAAGLPNGAYQATENVRAYAMPITLPELVDDAFIDPPVVGVTYSNLLLEWAQDRTSFGIADSSYSYSLDYAISAGGVVENHVPYFEDDDGIGPAKYTAAHGSLWYNFDRTGNKAIRCRHWCVDSVTASQPVSLGPPIPSGTPPPGEDQNYYRPWTLSGSVARTMDTLIFRDEFFMTGDPGDDGPYREITQLPSSFSVSMSSVTSGEGSVSSTNDYVGVCDAGAASSTITATAGRQVIALDYDSTDGSVVMLELVYPEGQWSAWSGDMTEYDGHSEYEYAVTAVYTRYGKEHSFPLFDARCVFDSYSLGEYTMSLEENVMPSKNRSNLNAMDLREGIFVLTEVRVTNEVLYDQGMGTPFGQSTGVAVRKDTLVVCVDGEARVYTVPRVTGHIDEVLGDTSPVYEMPRPQSHGNQPGDWDSAGTSASGNDGVFWLRPHGSDGFVFQHPLGIAPGERDLFVTDNVILEESTMMGPLKVMLGMPAMQTGVTYPGGWSGHYQAVHLLSCQPRGGAIAVSHNYIAFNIDGYDMLGLGEPDHPVYGPIINNTQRDYKFWISAPEMSVHLSPLLACGQSAWLVNRETNGFYDMADVLGVKSAIVDHANDLEVLTGGADEHFRVWGSYYAGPTAFPDMKLLSTRLESIEFLDGS